MFISNQLVWALEDFDSKRWGDRAEDYLNEDLQSLDHKRMLPTLYDKFALPVPITVRVDKSTGAIL